MINLERVADQTGYLVMSEDGAVLSSGGELQNAEHVGNIIIQLLKMANKQVIIGPDGEEGFRKVSVNYDDHSYVVCLSNKKIVVVKRNFVPKEPVTV